MPIPIELQVAAIAVVFSYIVGFFVLTFLFFNYLITSIKTDIDIKKSASRLTIFYLPGGIILFTGLTERPFLYFQLGRWNLIGGILLVVNLLAVNYFFYFYFVQYQK